MKRLLSFLISSTIILAACTPSETGIRSQIPSLATPSPFPSEIPKFSIGDGGLITGKPCAAPCFFGVRVGKTTLDQVIPILGDNGISHCSQDVEPKITCGNSIIVGADKSTIIVNSIGYYPDNVITAEKIIQKYGAPDVIHVIPTGIPESPTTVVLFLFDELRMRIRLPEVEGTDYAVSASSEIELINYFDDTVYSELRQNMFSQSWKGYGVYHPDLNR